MPQVHDLYFDQPLARETAENQVSAVADIIDRVNTQLFVDEKKVDEHSDEWIEEYGKVTNAVAGPDSPHIPDEILPFWEQNDERLLQMYRSIINEWYGGESETGKKLLIAFDTMDVEGI